MPNNNASLSQANKAKQDEFYTQLPDIEKELSHYRDAFKGKVVFCNCDDPYESNFVKYFCMNFNTLGLKELIATCYDGSPIVAQQLSLFDEAPEEDKKRPYIIRLTHIDDLNGDGAVGLDDVEKMLKGNVGNCVSVLSGHGDFRSDECKELLMQSDIVVTNPPFSLFREYMAQLIDTGKKFIILGNQNALTYKEIFPLIMQNKVWLGYHCGHTLFSVPEKYSIPDSYNKEDRAKLRSNGYVIDENGRLWRNLGNICWFTNIDIQKRHEPLVLYKKYAGHESEYPKYDNYDAINVDKFSDIPSDYSGIVGVPVTFLNSYSPDQFEIIGITKTWFGLASKTYPNQIQISKNGEESTVSKLNDGPAMKIDKPLVGETCYRIGKDYFTQLYARVLIRNKHPEVQ
jgi:hypothetical protein